MQEPDRRGFIAGCIATGAVASFGLAVGSGEAIAAVSRTMIDPTDATVYFVRHDRLLVFRAYCVAAQTFRDGLPKVTLLTRADQRIHLPAGEFFAEREGEWVFERQPCIRHELASF